MRGVYEIPVIESRTAPPGITYADGIGFIVRDAWVDLRLPLMITIVVGYQCCRACSRNSTGYVPYPCPSRAALTGTDPDHA